MSNYVQIMFRTSKDIKTRLEHHAKRVGATMNALVREATLAHLDFLDEKEKFQKDQKLSGKGRGLASIPEHVKPRGLGPDPNSSTPQRPTTSPFALLKPAPYEVPDKVKRVFKGWARFLEEADGIVDTQQRTKTIIEDLRQRVEEKDVQPCYEAFVDFCAGRKDAKEKPSISVGEIPLVGDV